MGVENGVRNVASSKRHKLFLDRVKQELMLVSGETALCIQVLNYCLIAVEYTNNRKENRNMSVCDIFFATSVWIPVDTYSLGDRAYPVEFDEIGIGRLEGLALSKPIHKLGDINNSLNGILKTIYEVEIPDPNPFRGQPYTF